MNTFRTSYVYDYPDGAGPLRGSRVTDRWYARGETIAAMFGVATVLSSIKVKPPFRSAIEETFVEHSF